MFTDGLISIEDTKAEELKAIQQMERNEDTSRYIISYSLERHRAEFQKPDVFYKSIYNKTGNLAGFMILVLDSDEISLEFRRIVISDKGKGYGKRAVSLVDRICTEEFGKSRIWLDVFDFNNRGRHIYESLGYRFVKTSNYQGKILKIYEKTPVGKQENYF
jgi:RimJ/RimL family protein N-acetyltransferase